MTEVEIMTNSESLEVPEGIIEPEVEAICKRYRIDPIEARRILEENFANRPDLVHKIKERYPDEDVTRFSDYKQAIKDTRKEIYYRLRQYHRDKEKQNQLKRRLGELIRSSAELGQIEQVVDELLLTHVSTRERFDHYEAFYQALFGIIEPPRTILDIGCGLHPLSYPYQDLDEPPEIYIAIDKDLDVVDTLSIFAPYVRPTRLTPVHADLAEVNWTEYLPDNINSFDLAFMLKLIPVIHRQQRELLPKLAGAPAQQVLITASTEAMTRKEDISRREDRALREFIEMTGRQIIDTVRVENEFGYLLDGEAFDFSIYLPPGIFKRRDI